MNSYCGAQGQGPTSKWIGMYDVYIFIGPYDCLIMPIRNVCTYYVEN